MELTHKKTQKKELAFSSFLYLITIFVTARKHLTTIGTLPRVDSIVSYSFARWTSCAEFCSGLAPICSRVHCSITLQRPSICSTLLLACMHIRTLSVPACTVGATIGRTMNPLCWQKLAKLRGCEVKTGMMGDLEIFSRTRRTLAGGARREQIPESSW